MGKYFTYVYEFSNNYCYVGLTVDVSRRDSEHHRCGCVCQHSKVYGVEIPEVKVLESGLDEFEAQASEGNWCKYYVDGGWFLINKAPTGLFISSLGGICSGIGSLSGVSLSGDIACYYQVCLCDAQKCSTLQEFRVNHINSYQMSRKYGWEFDWLMKSAPRRSVTLEYSYDVMKDAASKCKSRTEFSLKYKCYYCESLKRGYLDDFFPKAIKTKIKDDKTVSDDELRKKMLSYSTKTEFYKAEYKYYEMCRSRGILKEFPSKSLRGKSASYDSYDEPLEKYGIADFFIGHKNVLSCGAYGKSYVFYPDGMSLYKVFQTQVSSVRRFYDKHGVLCFKLGSNYTHVFSIINDFVHGGKHNCYKLLGGDFSSFTMSDVECSDIDLSDFVEMSELKTFFINSHGDIYSKRHLMLMPTDVFNGYTHFCRFRVDRLVCKYFKSDFDGSKDFTIKHVDGNSLNNDVGNLEIVVSNRVHTPKNLFISDDLGDGHELSIRDPNNGELYLLGIIKHRRIVNSIKSDVISMFGDNANVSEWVSGYQCDRFKYWKRRDDKISMIERRVSSNGCYYSEVHKLWKSKIYYNEREYSLGYFKTFEAGKILYEEAVLYIKYNKFEEWYGNIKMHRNWVKHYFGG